MGVFSGDPLSCFIGAKSPEDIGRGAHVAGVKHHETTHTKAQVKQVQNQQKMFRYFPIFLPVFLSFILSFFLCWSPGGLSLDHFPIFAVVVCDFDLNLLCVCVCVCVCLIC